MNKKPNQILELIMKITSFLKFYRAITWIFSVLFSSVSYKSSVIEKPPTKIIGKTLKSSLPFSKHI